MVHKLPQNTSEKNVQELFGQFSAITNVKIDQSAFSDAVSPQRAMVATPLGLKDVTIRVSLPNGCGWRCASNYYLLPFKPSAVRFDELP